MSEPLIKTIIVEGKDQDEALEMAEIKAKEMGYKKVSLKNIVKLAFTVDLYDPIVVEEPTEEPVLDK